MLPMWKCCQFQCCQLPVAGFDVFGVFRGLLRRGGVSGGGAGVALRAESRITPPKIQGGAAEVNTPASFPTLSHNFGKPRSARRIRAARAGLERPRQAAAVSIPPFAKLVRLFALRAAFSVKITHGGIDSAASALSA